MSDAYSRKILKVVVAHCSNTIGWNGIQASSLDLLTDVLHKYIFELGRTTQRYSEQFGRTEANLDDLGLAFRDMGINIPDLSDYISNVEPSPFAESLPIYPITREPQLNFLKPGSHEVLSRPVHVHEHLPPMLPAHAEEEEKASETLQEITESSPVPPHENSENGPPGTTPSPRSIFKRPEMAEKRNRMWLEEEGQPLREITSVMMTTSGYLSSSREGKLPESRMPRPIVDLESEPPQAPEKKVTMKKLIEGIKKGEEVSKRKDREKEEEREREKEKEKEREKEREREREREREKEREREREREKELEEKEREKEVEKEREKELEKEKKEKPKKKRKPKVEMEEFNFFDEKSKEKAPVIPKVPPVIVSESKLQTDGTKQKLNIFRKISKIKEADQAAAGRSSTPVETFEKPMVPYPSSSMDDTDSLRPSSPPRTPSTPRTPEVPSLFAAQKAKKERKPKIKKEKGADKVTMPRPIEEKFPSPLPPVDKISAREERLWSKEEAAMKEPWTPKEEKSKDNLASTFDSMSPPKKKRGRPSKVSMTPEPSEPPKTPELPPPSPTMPPPGPPAANKPFGFPFTSPFAVPGLIPPPLFQNVPFNLLGMAPGLRPPLGLPAIPNIPGLSGTSAPHPAMPNLPLPSSLFMQQVSKPEAMKLPAPAASPTTKSPPKSGGIIDSLPDNVPAGYQQTEEEMAFNKKKEKREKKEKEKEKKKKEKKMKEKSGNLGGIDEDREKKIKKEKKKERKDKEKAIKAAAAAAAGVGAEKEELSTPSTVPKITFKFGGAPSSPRPATPETTPKLIFKPMAERMASPTPAFLGGFRDSGPSSSPAPPVHHAPPPDVAKFSALITRPPKTPKPSKKESAAGTPSAAPPTALSAALEKPSTPSPLPSTSSTPGLAIGGILPRTPSPSPKVRREKPQKPPKVTKDKDAKDGKDKDLKKKESKPGDVAVITETVGSYYDEFGNKIWICPACGRQDDGTPMIGCDECDDWYHWVCVGIRVPPAETENWYCQRCIAKKQGSLMDKKKGRKKKSL